MLRFLRNKAGYGLIETIISICVLSTITITSMTLLTNMMSSLEFFRSNVVAQTLATSKVNLLSVTDYASVVSEARAQVDTTYKLDRELVVNEVDLGGGNKKKDITINIYKTGAADTLFTMNYTVGAAAASTGPARGQQVFTANGNFTIPAGVTQVWVSGIGGGGSGAHVYNSDDYTANAGSHGAACKDVLVTGLTPGEVIPITVGIGGAAMAGGAYVSNGNNGTATSFGSYLTMGGGYGGIYTTGASTTPSSTVSNPHGFSGLFLNGVVFSLHSGSTGFGYGTAGDGGTSVGYGVATVGCYSTSGNSPGTNGFLEVQW